MSPRGLLPCCCLVSFVLVFAVLAVALVELRSHRTGVPGKGPVRVVRKPRFYKYKSILIRLLEL
jgi:hypothetical protein